ncbi:MAG: PQQ-binding-like beta-propeller repeat protein [Planctomycetaceae bacterium]
MRDRIIARSVAGVVFVILAAGNLAYGQFRVLAPTPEETPGRLMAILPSHEMLESLNRAEEALQQGRHHDAFSLLRRLLDQPDDYFIDQSMRQTLKSQIQEMIGRFTPEQQAAYELLEGSVARKLLEQALATGDQDLLAEVMRRFPGTAAAGNAGATIALHRLDRGDVRQAASLLGELRRNTPPEKGLDPELGFREAIARQLIGDTRAAAELLFEIRSQSSPARIRLAGQELPSFASVDQAAAWLTQSFPASNSPEIESRWLSLRGSSNGANPADEAGAIGQPLWKFDQLAGLASELSTSADDALTERLSRLLQSAESSQLEPDRAPLSTLAPVISEELAVFRTARDVVALDRRTGSVRWRSVWSDPLFNQFWSAESVRASEPEQPLRSGLTSYMRDRLFEDRTYGALSSDGRLVFAVDSISPLMMSQELRANGRPVIIAIPGGEPLMETFNFLRAYDLSGGRLVWEIGGSRLGGQEEFAGHFFLGPPLSHEGRLYALAEVQGEIRLLVLEADSQGVRTVWAQPILAPELRVAQGDERRRMGLMPAIAHGMAVCPTGSGVVIGVDLTRRQLRWAHNYSSDAVLSDQALHDPLGQRRLSDLRAVSTESESPWRDGNPVIAGGRVLITPMDAEELHCLDLETGEVSWTAPREQGLFLAGANHQQVVVVEADRLRGLRVADGAPSWTDPSVFPAPTGRGLWLEDRYLLPLSSGEIVTLDLNSGRILARAKLPEGTIPGNLAAGTGALFSVSPRQVVSFRRLPEISEEIARRLETDPQDAVALALRGEWRLHHRDADQGITDLRQSVQRQPESHVKMTLATALLEGLRTDFERYRDGISELETLMDDPKQRQDALWLIARGLEGRGERSAALARLMSLVEAEIDQYSLEQNWQVRNDRRLSAYLARMYETAGNEERAEMDRSITNWLPTNRSSDPKEIRRQARRYLRCFGFHPSAVTVRQQLAAALDPVHDAVEFEMEYQQLSRHPDPIVAGPAAARLLRWWLDRKRYDDVKLSLPEFTARFADIECEPKLTGKQIAETILADEGFRKFSEWEPAWPAGEIQTHVTQTQVLGPPTFRVATTGPIPPRYRGWSFHTDANATMLVASDGEGRQQWRLNHPVISELQLFGGNLAFPGLQKICLQDHLVAWSTGMRLIVAADVEPEREQPRILWTAPIMTAGEFEVRPRIFGTGLGQFGNGRQRGDLVAIVDSAVVYHNGRTLFAAELTTGNPLWSRKDLSAQSFVSADARAVVLSDRGHHLASSHSVTVLRTSDGAVLSRQEAPPTKSVLWRGGSRQLTLDEGQASPDNRLPLQLDDLVLEKTIWNAELTSPIRPLILNDSEIVTIEENRRLTVRDLLTGEIRWSKDLDVTLPVETMWVQPWKDRYLITVGKARPSLELRIDSIDGQQSPIDGFVFAIDQQSGEQLWSARVEATAYDVTQPAGWPVLGFVGRKVIPPKHLPAPVTTKLTATFIDKRTGNIVFSKDESANPNISTYLIQIDPDRNRFVANFLAWSLELHYTGKPAP